MRFKFWKKKEKEEVDLYTDQLKNNETLLRCWEKGVDVFCFPEKLPKHEPDKLDLQKIISILDNYLIPSRYVTFVRHSASESSYRSEETAKYIFNHFMFQSINDVYEDSYWVYYVGNKGELSLIASQRIVYEVLTKDDDQIRYRDTDENDNVKFSSFYDIEKNRIIPYLLYIQYYLNLLDKSIQNLKQVEKYKEEEKILQNINEKSSCETKEKE